jgi:hypothetical protein
MKDKKHSRKLDLNRETLLKLDLDKLANVQGGEARTLSWTGCDSARSYGQSV